MDVATLLLSNGASLLVGYALFQVQEPSRRRRHSSTLSAALRGELERLEHALTSVVYLRGPGEPTSACT